MAFKYQLRIPVHHELRCGDLAIYEVTGAFDANGNPTGWGNGTTNPDITLVTSAPIKLIFSNGTVYTGNLFSASLPFPNIQSIPVILTSTTIGEAIPDGKINVEAEVIGEYNAQEGVLGKFVGTFYNTCNVYCCVQKLHALVNTAVDPCSHKSWGTFIKAREMYLGLLGAIECKNWNKADQILKALQTICLNNNCNCGC